MFIFHRKPSSRLTIACQLGSVIVRIYGSGFSRLLQFSKVLSGKFWSFLCVGKAIYLLLYASVVEMIIFVVFLTFDNDESASHTANKFEWSFFFELQVSVECNIKKNRCFFPLCHFQNFVHCFTWRSCLNVWSWNGKLATLLPFYVFALLSFLLKLLSIL